MQGDFMAAARPKIAVLGGGFGGLECASSLRSQLPEADITLVSDDDRFIFKPDAVHIPFGSRPETMTRRIRSIAIRRGINFARERAYEIDPDRKVVVTSGRVLTYDFLVVATGAGTRSREIQGLAENSTNIWSLGDMVRLRQQLRRLLVDARNGRRSEVVFVVAQNSLCSGPVYEIALMLDTWLSRHGVRGLVGIALVTHEETYLQSFGPAMHEHVAGEFLERAIAAHSDLITRRVGRDHISFRNGRELPFDVLVAMPPHVAATAFTSLPVDERGFLVVDSSTCAVHGHPDAFAVGDCGNFPVKQGVLAITQAAVVAENVASLAHDEEPRAGFEPNTFCLMDELSTATYAQVPIELTDDAGHPVAVRDDAEFTYRIGSARPWRTARRALRMWVPARLGRLQPVHAGITGVRGSAVRRAATMFSKKVPAATITAHQASEIEAA